MGIGSDMLSAGSDWKEASNAEDLVEKTNDAKRRWLITNVVYGPMYQSIFCELHLPSFLDESNIPAHKDRMSYFIFSDDETAPKIGNHPNYKKLKELLGEECQIVVFQWNENQGNQQVRFNSRYNILINMFRESVGMALKKNAYLSAIVADLVCARDFVPKCLEKMDKGHGAVFMLPMRTASESVAPGLMDYFQKTGRTPDSTTLFNMTYPALHPLWTACHWDQIHFTRLPFALLWNSGKGLLAKSFSVTPIIFEPTVHMLTARQVIDVEIPAHCKNVYWCENWDEAPILGAEPVVCYYPPFTYEKADEEKVGLWAQKSLHPTQFHHLPKNLYFPNKELAGIPDEMQKRADKVAEKIGSFGGHLI